MKKMLSLVMALALIISCLCLPASAEVAYTQTLRVEVFDRSIAGLNIEDCWQLHYAQIFQAVTATTVVNVLRYATQRIGNWIAKIQHRNDRIHREDQEYPNKAKTTNAKYIQ